MAGFEALLDSIAEIITPVAGDPFARMDQWLRSIAQRLPNLPPAA
jgi:hypothetical protein